MNLSSIKQTQGRTIRQLVLLCLTLLFSTTLIAQTRTLKGVVKDTKGEAVIGANIKIKGANSGAISDLDGQFTLNLQNNENTLQVSYVGYIPKEVDIKGKNSVEIILSEDQQSIDEIVVIGYGSVGKRELTSAVSNVSSKDFLSIGSNNPAMQIAGKVAGVSITNTAMADPNANPNIQIRGASSRSAGLGPLIVIDGVPGGNLQNINENDIESITVLKDGAASAIYGTRGSNGVILITTKSGGKDGSFSVNYNGYISLEMPKKQLEVLSADEFVQHPDRGTNFGHKTDWFDAITRTGITHNHAVQVAGGNAKNNYRASIDVRDAQGIDIRSGRKEFGARFSLNHTAPNDLYKITVNVAPRVINKTDSDHAMFSQALTLNPTFPIMNPDKPTEYYLATGWEAQNPVEKLQLEKSGGEFKMLDWDGTFRLNLLPLFGGENKHTLNTQVTVAQQINDDLTYWFRPSTSTLAQLSGRKGEANQRYSKQMQQSLEWIGNYSYTNKGHNVKGMVGYSYQYFRNNELYAENKDFTSDALEYNRLQDGTYMSEKAGRLGMSSGKNDAKLIAFFGRVSYDYQGKYLATASLRYEGSSKFGVNNKWGYFPAISVGWRISQEEFMKGISWIDDLKIRGDYGETGNQNFDSYKSLSTMGGYGQVFYNGKYYTGWSPNVNVNSNLRWEKGKNWNIGLDFGLFKNRLSGSLNYYNRTQQDLLGDYDVAVPPNIQTSSYANVGTMKNTGFEAEINVTAIQTKDFTYDIGLVASTTSNKFVSFSNSIYTGQSVYWQDGFPAPGSPGPVQRIEEGQRIGNFVTFRYAGVDEAGNWMVYNKDGKEIPIKEGVDADKQIVGNGLPKFTMTLNNTFRYKKFDLTLYFRGNFGYQVYDIHNFYWGLQSAAPNLNVLKSAYNENSHIKTGMNQHNSYFVRNADFIKLDVATLGYNMKFNSKWIQNLRLYITGRNLFTITGYKGVDPDVFPVNGLMPGVPENKKSYYPSTIQLLFGAQVSF